MIRRALVLLCWCFALWSGGMGVARAHELQPAYLELRQTGADTYHVLWKVPPRDDLAHGIRPEFPDSARVLAEPIIQQTATAYTERFMLSCPGGLAGKNIGVTGAMAALADVLVRIQRLDGTTQIARLTPDGVSPSERAARVKLWASTTRVNTAISAKPSMSEAFTIDDFQARVP